MISNSYQEMFAASTDRGTVLLSVRQPAHRAYKGAGYSQEPASYYQHRNHLSGMKESDMSTNWRVAIASLDGKVINEHFGRAKAFFIIDLAPDGTYTLFEKRDVTPLCDNGEHSQEGLLNSISALSDCSAVLVSRIGMAAKRALELNRISVFEQPDYIDSALSKLAKYFAKTNFTLPEE